VFILALILWLSSQTTPPTTLPTSTKEGLRSEEILKGQIVEKIVCADAPNQSYALYLPANYSTRRKWPVLYAFDPAARGQIPVERFREAAERFGWIVVGSNNSRNGDFQPSIDAWNAIVNDTHQRFEIDDARTYVAGFSGGARLAFYFAIRCSGCIAGVISSGAGFPSGVTPSPALHFAVFTATGIEDFNFGEVKSLNDALSKAGMAHRTQVFPGRHDWPPSFVAIEALEWMELQAMKSGKRTRDDALIESIWQTRLQQARDLEASHQTFGAYQTYAALADGFQGLRDTTTVAKAENQLHQTNEVRSAIRDELQQIKKQREIETRFYAGLVARERNSGEEIGSTDGVDPETRRTQIVAELRKQAALTADTGERRIARRVLEGLFISLFEQGVNQLQALKHYDDAVRSFKLATEVNPERPGAFFYLAWAYAARGDRKQALRALQAATDKNFSDLKAIEGNKAFDSIRAEAQYQEIIKTLQSRH
jgi:predicted esterase/tetratricopeptide (TPR) repeat protein